MLLFPVRAIRLETHHKTGLSPTWEIPVSSQPFPHKEFMWMDDGRKIEHPAVAGACNPDVFQDLGHRLYLDEEFIQLFRINLRGGIG